MAKSLKIGALVFASIYLMLAIGVPIYQIHCRASGETRTNLLIEVDSCEGICSPADANDSCHCCCSCGGDEHKHSQAPLAIAQHGCDETTISLLKFNGEQDKPLSQLQKYLHPKTLDVWMPYCTLNVIDFGERAPAEVFDVGHPIRSWTHVFDTSNQALNFICQRKEPLSVA